MEHCKELDNLDIGPGFFGQSQTVFQNPSPMRYAMIAVQWQHVIFEDSRKDERDVHFHAGYFAWPNGKKI